MFLNYRNESGKLHEIVNQLIWEAIVAGIASARAPSATLERLRREGKEIPDWLLPGRTLLHIMTKLPEEARKLIKKLKAKHFNHFRVIDLGVDTHK